jgi:anti-sigma factor RsiW
MPEPFEMTCKELVELVTEYLEGTLPGADRNRFEDHLKVCPYCVTYLDQMRMTIRMLGKLSEELVPEDAKQELLRAFRDWKTKPPTEDSRE